MSEQLTGLIARQNKNADEVATSLAQTSEALGISTRTVKRHWAVACAWLARELEGRSPA